MLAVLLKLMGSTLPVILCRRDVAGGSWAGITAELRLLFKKAPWLLGNKREDEVATGLRLRGTGGSVQQLTNKQTDGHRFEDSH